MEFLKDLVLALAQQMALGLALVTALRLALHLATRMGWVAETRPAESDQARVQDW